MTRAEDSMTSTASSNISFLEGIEPEEWASIIGLVLKALVGPV